MASTPLADIARSLSAGNLSPTDLAEQAIAARRADLDAYVTFEPDQVRASAAAARAVLAGGVSTGPLLGIPVSIKDLFMVPDYPTFAGSPRALPEALCVPGPIMQSILRQLAVVMGKTHTVEFAFGGIGANAHWATPKNPWDRVTHRVPGGSSSGAAVSVVEGSALFALGTDTAGSVRIPAAWNGLVGLKTTAGRWSTEGVVPLSHTLDTVGVIANTVGDARYVFAALDDEAIDLSADPPLPSALRLGVAEGPLFEGAELGVVESVQSSLRELQRAGMQVERVDFAPTQAALDLFMRGSVAAAELWAYLRRELPQWVDTLEPRVKARVASAEEMPAREYLDRRAALDDLAARAELAFGGFDALLAPTVANSPPTFQATLDPERYRAANLLSLRNTSVANTLGLCAITLPVGKDAQGMPVGLMLMGRARDEVRLLQVAEAVERVLGTGRDRLGVAPRLLEGSGALEHDRDALPAPDAG